MSKEIGHREPVNPYEFRRLPLVIEAWCNLRGNPIPEPPWLVEAKLLEAVRPYPNESDGSLQIVTLEGKTKCRHGDWIVRGVMRELYAVRPVVFEQLYEAVADEG